MNGHRCIYSCEALQMFGGSPYRKGRVSTNRRGIIVRQSSGGKCWAVKWDDRQSIQIIHKDFIEVLVVNDQLMEELKASPIF